MERLIELLNKLAIKYSFEEEDKNEINKAIMAIEDPDPSGDADLDAEDFVAPENPDEDGLSGDV
jgi:hypothetical protein